MEKEQRNIFTAITLSLLVLIGFNYFYKSAKPQPTVQKPIVEKVVLPKAVILDRVEALAIASRVKFETGQYKGSIDIKTGRLDDLVLKNYKETTDSSSENVAILSPLETKDIEYLEFAPQDIETSFHSPLVFEVVSSSDQQIRLKSHAENYDIERIYTFKDNYRIHVEDRVTNKTNVSKRVQGYAAIFKLGTPLTHNVNILHEGLVGVLKGKLEELNYKKLNKDNVFKKETDEGWIGFTNKYFMTSLILKNKTTATSERFDGGFIIRSYAGVKVIHPQETVSIVYDVFSGPKELKVLETIEAKERVNKFHLAVDFGWFYIITKPLFKLLTWLNEFFHNFGLSLIIVTIFLKLLMFPFARKAHRSMKGVKMLQMKSEEIRAKYPNDKLRQQQEILRLYQKENVHPTSGCLPILMQLPIFFALYKVLYVTIEMRQAPFWGWVKDLSMPDTLYFANGFGFFDFVIPAFLQIGVWPILMGISMYVQQKMNPISDPAQEKAMLLMPFLFTFLFSGFPVGLVIYWTLSNILSIIQQWILVKYYD